MLPEFLKVAKKAFVILILLTAFDILFGLMYRSFYLHQGPSRFSKMIYGDNGGQKEEIIILGDSRAEHHYNSQMISDHTGKTVYNYGSDGQSVFYNYAVLRKLLDSYIPEKVIYEISLTELVNNQQSYDRLLYFLPLENKYADNIVKKHSNSFKLFVTKLFNSYKYNSTVFIILKSYLSPKEYFAGYQPLSKKMKEDSYTYTTLLDRNTNYPLDSMKIHYFEEILKLAEEYNFDMEFFISPTLTIYENDILFSSINRSLSKFNYTANIIVNDSTYTTSSFADLTHLNCDGANQYTNKVITLLNYCEQRLCSHK